MSFPLIKIGDVAEINPRMPKDTDGTQEVSFLGMASVSENGKLLKEEFRTLAETKKGFTFFTNEDVLLAKITPCFENGKSLHAGQLSNPIGFGSTEFHVIRANSRILDSTYLFYMVWNQDFRFYGQKAMSGAAGQKRISTNFVRDYEIPLPPLPEQQRIAAILDKADAIRRKRQQAIELADEFLRAVFLDMFGDPVANPKSIRVFPMTECFDITTGKLNSNAAIENGMYPFFTCAKDVFAINEYAFDQEALLLAGNNAQAEYDVKYYNGKFNAYQRTYVLTLKDNNWSYPFYKFALEYQLQNLKQSSKGTSTKYITMEIMQRTLLPAPNIELQREFAQRVQKTESLKAKLKASLAQADEQFNALSQRAFAGSCRRPSPQPLSQR